MFSPWFQLYTCLGQTKLFLMNCHWLKILIIFACMHMCVWCMYIVWILHVWVHICEHMNLETWSWHWVFSVYSHLTLLRQDLPLIVELPDLDSQVAVGIPCLCLLCTGIVVGLPYPARFYMGSGYPNSGPHTCTTSSSPTAEFSQPHKVFTLSLTMTSDL